MARYAAPGERGSVVSYRDRYDHFIGGECVPPARGGYSADPSPVTGEVFTEVARGTAEDVHRALEAAHAAAPRWGRTSTSERAHVLNEVADRVEDHLDSLAVAETWDTGAPVREALADLPRAVDCFRHFAAVIRTQRGGVSDLGDDLLAYHFAEPLGVVDRFVPWRSPLLMAALDLAPALAAGNTALLRPSDRAPASIHVLVDLVGDLLPPGVVNVVNGVGSEEDEPSGGKGADVFFADVADRRDAFYDRALEGFATFALDRALVQTPIHDRFLTDAVERARAAGPGHPLDTDTTVGALTGHDQLDRTLSLIEVARRDGARVVCGGERVDLGGELSGGSYLAPTVVVGESRVARSELVGPVVWVTSFDHFDDAVKELSGTASGVGVWSREAGVGFRAGRRIRTRRVRVNTFRPGAADHHALLDQYQRTKTILVEQGA
ncbi:aldehyde dehydrogenase family protein [Actinosynnema sp. NPDC023658]|uniref:aldehyde dehydrogenase family protein n=1 Tax=Actinosynnema sp. NPDC023658 TaxID=3155465 RepID=UPI00340B5192